jgi:hypothetical protein
LDERLPELKQPGSKRVPNGDKFEKEKNVRSDPRNG